MSSCYILPSKCFTGKQSVGHPQGEKQAIGWKIYYLKGIRPLVCTHHIYLDDEERSVR